MCTVSTFNGETLSFEIFQYQQSKNPVKQLLQNEFNNETNLTIKVSQNYWTPQDHEHDLNSQPDLPFSWSLLAFGEGVNEPVSVVFSMLTSADQCAQWSSSYWCIGNVHNSFFHFNPVPPDGIPIQWIQTDCQPQCFLLDSHVLTKLRRKFDHRIREILRLWTQSDDALTPCVFSRSWELTITSFEYV